MDLSGTVELKGFSTEVNYWSKLSKIADIRKIKVPRYMKQILGGRRPGIQEKDEYESGILIAENNDTILKDVEGNSRRHCGLRQVRFEIVNLLPRKNGTSPQDRTLSALKKRGLRPANLRELIFFGNTSPHKPSKKIVVVACGSEIENQNVKEYDYPTLTLKGRMRELGSWNYEDLDYRCGSLEPEPDMESNFKLLAVKE